MKNKFSPKFLCIGKVLCVMALVAMMLCGLALVGCKPQQVPSGSQPSGEVPSNTPTPSTPQQPEVPAAGSKILIAYFSCTNTTKSVAEGICRSVGGTLYRIEPAQPYTSADLNYNNSNSRANIEQNDSSCRPQIASEKLDVANFDIVFVGYPIWWGKLPKIMLTFLETYDFSGKTVIPFCTSGSSGIATSVSEIKACQPQAKVDEGRRFGSGATDSQIKAWTDTLVLSASKEVTLKITVNGQTLLATLEDNSSAQALTELLQKGSITLQMEDYANFEKVGTLPESLPRNDFQTTTQAGDLILYLGNKFVIYYDTNSWNFTRLGKITNANQAQLKALLGTGDVTAVLSLD